MTLSSIAAATSATATKSRVRISMLLLILFLSTVAYADRSILSIAGSTIQKEFGLSAVQLGYILSAFSWAYVIGQIPGGLILDRFGTKAVYGTTLVLWSVATLLMGFVGELSAGVTGTVVAFFALRCLLGLIEAPSFPANARVAVMWFPKSERGRATSLFASSQYFAVGIFSPLAGWLVQEFGWPWPFFVLGVIGILAAVVWFSYMQEPRQHPGVSSAELDHIVSGGGLVDIDSSSERTCRTRLTREVVLSLLTSRMLWCAYLGQYCAIAISYFFITWFPIYLIQARGMNIMQAGFATIAPSLFGFLGGISGGIISDWLIKQGWSVSWARKTPYIIGMLAASGLVLAAVAESNFAVIALMSLAFYGKGVAAGAGTWAVVSDTAPKAAVGLAGSVFNCVGNIAGIVTPIVFGYIVQATGGYSAGLYFVGAHCLFAAFLFMFAMGRIERIGERAA
ncbi:MFS transporter [Xanthobacter versatilis]|uniref:MFS transporter n=1 Tax=Xanthobacter autotrophicus (strain ATCC BAA-1158 / Py2) TaxID=78245 RepID=UPI0037270352